MVLSIDHTTFVVAWWANRRSPTPPPFASLHSMLEEIKRVDMKDIMAKRSGQSGG